MCDSTSFRYLPAVHHARNRHEHAQAGWLAGWLASLLLRAAGAHVPLEVRAFGGGEARQHGLARGGVDGEPLDLRRPPRAELPRALSLSLSGPPLATFARRARR